MAEYINRNTALSFPFANGHYDREHANEHFIYGCESYREWLEQIPAADVVEAKRGKWLWDGEGYLCTNCCSPLYGCSLEIISGVFRHCPFCGAKMDGDNT